jgi:hypothetical protein
MKLVAKVFIFLLLFAKLEAQSAISTDSLLQLVREAYIYGFPAEQVYRMYVTLPDNTGQTRHIFNHFSYADKLASASPDNKSKIEAYKKTRNRGGAGPNNDTPYFGSLIDLSEGPLVLSIPDFGNRYFSFHFIDFANRNIYYIGSSFGDTVAAKYLIIGPDWNGEVPKGLKPVRLTVNRLNLFGRTLVEDDTTDLKKVLALQHQASLTPLNKWPSGEGKDAGIELPNLPVYYESIDSFFTNLNHSLKLSPAPAQDQPLLRTLAVFGIGTKNGFEWNHYDAATRRRIHNTLIETDSLLDTEGASGDNNFGNGWQRTNPLIGEWGTHYLDRSLYMKHGFYAGHTETECFYIVPVSREGHGYFKGDHKYKIHFTKNKFPPVGQKGFWSFTANEIPGYFLIPNSIHRYAIRDRTKGLRKNPDGSLDIYIQSDPPAADKLSNWLPIAKGESTITVRVYIPQKPLLDGTYQLPPIETIE